MKHNVESEPKGHDEERIPKKEREEGLENLVNRFDNCFELWKTNLKLEISVMIVLNFEEKKQFHERNGRIKYYSCLSCVVGLYDLDKQRGKMF